MAKSSLRPSTRSMRLIYETRSRRNFIIPAAMYFFPTLVILWVLGGVLGTGQDIGFGLLMLALAVPVLAVAVYAEWGYQNRGNGMVCDPPRREWTADAFGPAVGSPAAPSAPSMPEAPAPVDLGYKPTE